MHLSAFVFGRLPWLNLPIGILIALLQRTPAVRMFVQASDYVLASPAGQLLRASLTAAALGAMHSRAGATQFVGPSGPVSGTVGTPLTIGFTYNGTPSAPARFAFSGSLPSGLQFQPAPIGNIINSGTPVVTGTPIQAGTFTIGVQGFNVAGLTNNLVQTIIFQISAGSGSNNVAPTISTQPIGANLTVGQSVTLTTAASGAPAPTYQWSKDGANIAGASGPTYAITNTQTTDAGVYTVVVTNSAGSVTSQGATVTVTPPGGPAPTLTVQPVPQTVAEGSTVVFSITATGATGYQWRRDGVDVTDGTGPILVVSGAGVANAGVYAVVVSNAAGSTTSNGATLSIVATADNPGRLTNLSILTPLQPGETMTMGTVLGGEGTGGTKPLLVRAAGPALAAFGVSGVLPDPTMTLVNTSVGSTVSTNDDWGGAASLSSAFSSVGAFPFENPVSKDAAIFEQNLPPANYTVQVSDASGASGTVIAELYDATPNGAYTPATPRLVNVSVLKEISMGDSLTTGFFVGGTTGKTVLIRAIGPRLGLPPFNFGTAMSDPQLTLFNGSQEVIAGNDNWGGLPAIAQTGSRVGAFPVDDGNSRDAILPITLAPGLYTVRVSPVTVGGTVIVEMYEVP